jgi:hypothetical protein
MTVIHEDTVQTPKTYHITLISDSRLVWLTHEKPVADQNGILVFIDSCGNEITVPQSAVWIEEKKPKK